MATDKSLILSDQQFRSKFLSTSSSSAIRVREKSPTFQIDLSAPVERTQGHGSCDRREFDLLM